MKNLSRILAGFIALASMAMIQSCDNEDPKPVVPSVGAPTTTADVQIGTTTDVSFEYTAPGGFASSAVTATGGTAIVKTDAAAGETEGTIVVTFTAGANAGAGSVTLTVTDNANQSISATALLNVTLTAQTITLQGDITSNLTLDATKRYLIKGKVYVNAPAKLTIPAGTLLLGDKDSDGTLIINRGASIDAQGTAADPIIMTSAAPKGFRNRGDWGGLVILGKAYNSNNASATIEGITASAGSENGVYGPGSGNAADNDNSGILKYVRIEFAGIALSQDNELNSLTLGSVGSGTTIDHIMVSYGNDDAYEWFGGSVNHKYLIAYSTIDDDFDTDRGYNGKVQYALVVRDPAVADFSGSRAWESSSNNSATAPTVGGVSRHSAPKFSHVTVLGPLLFRAAANISGFYRAALEVNSNSAIQVHNSIITGFPNSTNFATAGSVVTSNVFAANTTQAAAGASAPPSFATDNVLDNSVSGIFGAFPSGSLYSFENFPKVQAATSPYLTGAVDLSADAFFDNAAYKGAFGATSAAEWNFATGWVNFDPNSLDYQ
ncbi:MAG TPA: T9SS C-terminal target domain-containing protein [Chryseosolibacter sp.]